MTRSRLLMNSAGVFFLLPLLILLFTVPNTWAAPFQEGSRRLSIVAGSGRNFDNNYMVIGFGAGFFVVDGLELGLDGEAWLGGEPDIYKVSPHLNYVLPIDAQMRPYAGIFYRHIFISDFDDQDSVGLRAGVNFITDRQWYFGAGVVYETYLDCDESVMTCDDLYPEVTFAITF